jgi:glutamine amidotransferase
VQIAIIDYKMGNIASLKNSLAYLGYFPQIITKAVNLNRYDKLILPGVGAFKDASKHLKEENLDSAIEEFVKTGKDILGICLGMQLLFQKSQEAKDAQGLGLIEGEIVKFTNNLKVPHMGWNKLFTHHNSPLFKNLPKEFFLYFVHSYYAQCDKKYMIGSCDYGFSFAAAVQKDNIFGIQPHPEKSHNTGLQILKNFLSF